MALSYLQELLRRVGRLAAALLPLLKSALRHPQRCGRISGLGRFSS